MNAAKFLLWSSIGTVVWTGLLTALGYWLGSRFDQVDRWLAPVSWTIVAFAVCGYLYRLYRMRDRD